jgi:hypothetical protein
MDEAELAWMKDLLRGVQPALDEETTASIIRRVKVSRPTPTFLGSGHTIRAR